MAPNIAQSGTAGRHVWYTGDDRGSSPHMRSFSFSVLATGGSHDVEADHGHDGRTGLLRAAAGGAGARGDAGQRDDAHGPSGRPELFHDKRGVGRGPQGLRAGVRQGGGAARHPVERRHDLRAGERQAGGSPELEAGAVHRGQGEGDGHASHGERVAHHRDQDGRGRDLMRRALGAGLLAAALVACGSPAPSGLTLLFFRRSPAASLGGLSWAPDPDNSRLVGFDARLRVARSVTSSRLANPMAVATLGTALLVTERTGEGIVLDTTGRPVREWESPNPASLYAAGGGTVVAVRSPYYIPQFTAEPDTAPLIRILDTLGKPVAGLATIHLPPVPFLAQLANAGAVTVGPDGSVYFAPLVRDEIRKYSAGGTLRWTAKRGLFRTEADPEFLPAQGRDIGVRKALVNVALALGPDGRLYALGSDDSGATKLRVDVIDTASGAILATRHLAARETAVAVGARSQLATFDADSLVAGLEQPERELFTPAFALPDVRGDTVTLARFAGKVTLVNFWASWCDPCREEFPHMAELYREFARQDFEIAAISDDVDRGKMLAFVRQFRPPFPILVGGGRMKQTYHYRGLPYSVLLDRRGRIIERIFGFGGAAEFANMRRTIANEVRAP
ncbi:MAG: hypothetical protein DMD69_05250 [Gemmatimonadetes bacterium]|nr:MAG: hypothetical protein DMD69_05250 [Gemmatimonadota bacterium]